MLPTVDDVFLAYNFLAQRFGLTDGMWVKDVRAALAEANELARSPEDEPAALFYALARRPEEMGDGWTTLPALLASNHAARLGLRLDARSDDLARLRFDIVVERLSFEAVRSWFRQHTKPVR